MQILYAYAQCVKKSSQFQFKKKKKKHVKLNLSQDSMWKKIAFCVRRNIWKLSMKY